MKKLKIGVVATHSFPVPYKTHTGDVVISDLVRSLDELGHEVTFYAPEGSYTPPNGRLLPMPASYGKAPPFAGECEQQCWDMHTASIRDQDVVHDFSINKRIVENLMLEGRSNVLSTLLGGSWLHPNPPLNIVLWSQAMRTRGLSGLTDYHGTPTPDLAGPPQSPIRDAHVVYGGVDTDFYSPGDGKKDSFFLWMNRWHRAKGYHVAIEVALRTGIDLVLAGEAPEREMFEHQRQCALEAFAMAKDLPNVSFVWLPSDPEHHTAKRDLYRRAKALLYTVQFQEPFGLSQVEALACGTPVVGTNFGSVPEVIEDGLTGWVRPNNALDLSEAVTDIPLISVSDACRSEAVRRFDRKVMANNYLLEYAEVMAGRSWGG